MNFTEKQGQILATAEKLFAVSGYEGTSVRDIADTAGVNIAMISYYFGSKEKLMEALFQQRSNLVKMKVEVLLQDEALTPMEKMYSLAQEYTQKLFDKHHFFKIMMCEQIINKNPVVLELLGDLKKRNAEEISRLIIHGQENGAFKKDVDIMLLINTLNGVTIQTLIGQDVYRHFHKLEDMPDEQFKELLKKNLVDYLKVVLKALLHHEA